MSEKKTPRIEVCSDCVDRRGFLRRMGAAAAIGATAGLPMGGVPIIGSGLLAEDEKKKDAKKKPTAESFVKLLYTSLTDEQKKAICMPFDHKKRSTVRNNWHIVPQKKCAISTFFDADQQELVKNILKGVTSEDGYERFAKQMQDDDGGIGRYTCAIFGEPDTGKFEWVLTGRHLTIRCDGDSVEHTAFGGPLFYGHAVTFDEKPDHPGNVWWHQARLANQVYAALDGKQREKALAVSSPPDAARSIKLQGAEGEFEGLSASEMSKDQQKLLKGTLESLMSMYRKSDVDEALECIDNNGGMDALRVVFYEEEDIGDDKIWDRWKVEGPGLAWYFRGSPHVHTWVNIGDPASKKKADKKEA